MKTPAATPSYKTGLVTSKDGTRMSYRQMGREPTLIWFLMVCEDLDALLRVTGAKDVFEVSAGALVTRKRSIK
jgi:hypothetical protein